MKRRALVVEDDTDVRDLIAAFVENTGKFETVDKVSSAEEALNIFEVDLYGLAVIDIGLIIMSGVDLSFSMREMDPDVILVAITGHTELVEQVDLSVAGFNAWFTKPVGYVEFLNFIEELP